MTDSHLLSSTTVMSDDLCHQSYTHTHTRTTQRASNSKSAPPSADTNTVLFSTFHSIPSSYSGPKHAWHTARPITQHNRSAPLPQELHLLHEQQLRGEPKDARYLQLQGLQYSRERLPLCHSATSLGMPQSSEGSGHQQLLRRSSFGYVPRSLPDLGVLFRQQSGRFSNRSMPLMSETQQMQQRQQQLQERQLQEQEQREQDQLVQIGTHSSGPFAADRMSADIMGRKPVSGACVVMLCPVPRVSSCGLCLLRFLWCSESGLLCVCKRLLACVWDPCSILDALKPAQEALLQVWQTSMADLIPTAAPRSET